MRGPSHALQEPATASTLANNGEELSTEELLNRLHAHYAADWRTKHLSTKRKSHTRYGLANVTGVCSHPRRNPSPAGLQARAPAHAPARPPTCDHPPT